MEELDEDRKGLKAYMSRIETAHPDLLQYGLKKVGHTWGKSPGDGNVYYLFQPPWVKKTVSLE